MKPKISPSILAAEIINLKHILKKLSTEKIDFLHIDVMDGHFVPQLSFGEQIASEIKNNSKIPLDVHLMVDKPEQEIPKYFNIKPAHIVFHFEANLFPIRLLQEIRKYKIKGGIALNPTTPVSAIEPLIEYLDIILIMSVEPGFYGQSFLPASLKKLKETKKLVGDRPIQISMDGGIKADNIRHIAEIGIDFFVAGSAVFKNESIEKNIQNFENALNFG
jgi:ribulose-phosphate 3-epimerase